MLKRLGPKSRLGRIFGLFKIAVFGRRRVAANAQLAAFRRRVTTERIRSLAAMGGDHFVHDGAEVVIWWEAWFDRHGLTVDENVVRDAVELAYSGMPWKP